MNRAQLSTSKEPDHIRCRHFGNMYKVRDHTFGFRLPDTDFFSLKSAAEWTPGCGQTRGELRQRGRCLVQFVVQRDVSEALNDIRTSW